MRRESRGAAAWGSGEEGGELGWRCEAEDVGLVDRAGELAVVEDVGEVEQRLGRGGGRDAVVGGGNRLAGAMDTDAGMPAIAGRCDLDGPTPMRLDSPERRRARWLRAASLPQASTAAIAAASGDDGR